MTTETLPKQENAESALGGHVKGYLERVKGGELGALPAVFGLVILCVVFSVLRPAFLSAVNFANLFTQGAAVASSPWA